MRDLALFNPSLPLSQSLQLKLPFFLRQAQQEWRSAYNQQPVHRNIATLIRERAVTGIMSQQSLLSTALARDACTWDEQEWDVEGYDKIFAAQWLTSRDVICGTKCNQLFVQHLDVNRRVQIPLPVLKRTDEAKSGGVHSISMNSAGTMLAVGANQIIVYRLPDFEPLFILTGTTDWVFCVAWIDDETVTAGSRDGSFATWSVRRDYLDSNTSDPGQHVETTVGWLRALPPSFRHIDQVNAKVRDLQQCLTLSTDAMVRVWDLNEMDLIQKIPLLHHHENVCMASDSRHNLYAIGSQNNVSVLDMRTQQSIVHDIASIDDGYGVRSLLWNNHEMTIGGGLGRIATYDLRACRYTDGYMRTGRGWLALDSTYVHHFNGMHIANAVYALSRNANDGRMVAAGGPLQVGLKGCYAALWS